MTMENDLAEAQAAVRETLAQLRTVLQERDSYQRQLDTIGDAIVQALVHRIEPRLSRHPVTVIMSAGALIANIGEAIGCEFEDGDDLLEAVKALVCERDEARAERDQALCRQEDLEADVRYYEDRWESIVGGAYQRGAEAMREACARWIGHKAGDDRIAWQVARLPIPEEP